MKRTPLYDRHLAAGAKMTEFAGFEMPVHYEGVLAEHRAVRTHVGVFDVSHMGEIVLRGPDAAQAADYLLCNKVAALPDGKAVYAGLLEEGGGFVDDVVAYKISAEEILICVNAANREKDARHVACHLRGGVQADDEGDQWAQLAVQGPEARGLVDGLSTEDLGAVRRFRFVRATVAGVECLVARTGYTGEDGFELFCAAEEAPALWDAVIAGGAVPCGLGARDTLRLEAGLALYGNDIDASHTPLEAGLEWIVKFDKDDFVGKAALLAQKEAGLTRRLVGFELEGRGVPRPKMSVLDPSGEVVGEVTSGTLSPTLKKPIGMAYVPLALSEPGSTLAIDIRGRAVPARVVPLPFYKRT
ncbi:MAG: glycine cleavage system aminomethyltransferase GcvT [Deltaproteobacteria bacterium]|nr:MAG: glycine cleavage system aminomethyltransferase GcvT [Deltaproteobacteria bacterium]